MNWKEFFEPTKWKIISIILLILLLILPSFIIEACVNNLFNCQFLSNLSILFILLKFVYTIITFPIFLIFKLLGIPYQLFLPRILILLINLLYWYFLICLVMFMIKKFKR